MVSITRLEVLDNRRIHFNFSDDTEKTIDFAPFIGKDKLSSPLSDLAYFQRVKLYENGRGIYWPNDYDFCPDFLHQHQPSEQEAVTVTD